MKHSEETKAKLSVAARRRPPISDETRAKMSAAKMGHPVSQETREKIAAAKQGQPVTAETRSKRSAAMLRHYEDPAAREKTGAAERGELHHNWGRYAELSTGWKGDDIGYKGAHTRADKVLPKVCAHADDTCKGQLHAAFRHDTPAEFVKIEARHGRLYSPRPEHYMRLCHSHHLRYDSKSEGIAS